MNTEPNQPVTQASPFPVYGNGDCPHCGGKLIGDGFKTVIRCENAAESDYEFSEPDAQPVFCDPPTPLTDAEASLPLNMPAKDGHKPFWKRIENLAEEPPDDLHVLLRTPDAASGRDDVWMGFICRNSSNNPLNWEWTIVGPFAVWTKLPDGVPPPTQWAPLPAQAWEEVYADAEDSAMEPRKV